MLRSAGLTLMMVILVPALSFAGPPKPPLPPPPPNVTVNIGGPSAPQPRVVEERHYDKHDNGKHKGHYKHKKDKKHKKH